MRDVGTDVIIVDGLRFVNQNARQVKDCDGVEKLLLWRCLGVIGCDLFIGVGWHEWVRISF
jgi:hypothetical protein